MSWGYWDSVGPKNHTRKIYLQRFWTIPSLHAQFTIQKCLDIPIVHVAYKKNWQGYPHWFKGIDTLWSKGNNTFWYRKSKTKNHQYSRKRFEFYQLFMYKFLYQTVQKSKLLTTWLTKSCVITYQNLFISYLIYPH